MDIDQIASEALRLNSRERAVLAEVIWESLEDPYRLRQDSSDAESILLAQQRADELERGDVKPVSHKELMRRLRGNDS